MEIIEIPKDDNPTQEIQDNLNGFLNELVVLCNKRRIWVVLKATGYLRDEMMNGKLLDVAGFYYDEKSKNVFPFYVNRKSEETSSKE